METIADEYSGFILLDKDDHPKVALHIENEMRWAMKKYAKLHPDQLLPNITPRVFRHTFCTNMANAGMDIKNLQYLMGHSDVGATLNIYTHANCGRAAEQMVKLIDFRDAADREKLEEIGLILHHVLHHLPENLWRFTETYVGCEQPKKKGKGAKPVEVEGFVDL